MAILKILKLYAWEPFFEDKVSKIRKKETDNLRKFWILTAISNTIWICTPFCVRFKSALNHSCFLLG